MICMYLIQEFTSPSLEVAQAGNEGSDSDVEEQYKFNSRHIWLNQ